MKKTLRKIYIRIKEAPLRLRHWILWLQYRNKPYREYYRAVMAMRTARDPKNAVGGKWEEMGPRQLELLQAQGLRPHHSLLDIGCGSLRGGLFFIKYLEQGNYYGIDISPEIIKAGNDFLIQEKLTEKNPTLLINHDLSFSEFKDKTFDYLFAQSVLSHMPKEDINDLFSSVGKIMNTDSQFFATFFLDDVYHASSEYRNFHYPFEMLMQLGKENGLDVQLLPEDGHPRSQRLMRVTLSHN